jgi:hypothetical protein
MTLIEKAAYIKGLVDGMELDKESKEGKVIAALVDLLGEVVESIDGLEADVDELYEYAEELDEDLGEVESVLCEDDEDYDDFDDECDGMCDECDLDCDLDDDFFEIECPSCGEVVCFDESIDPEELACPACGEKFECLVDEDDLKAIDGE